MAALFPSISPKSFNKEFKKSLAKIICQQYADPINRDTISVCGEHAFDYLDSVKITNFLPSNSEIADYVYTLPFSFHKFDFHKISPFFNAKITYKDPINPHNNRTENGFFDISLPYDIDSSLIGIYTPLVDTSFTVADQISITNSQTLTFGEANSVSVSIASETALGGISPPISISVSGNLSFLSEKYKSTSTTITKTEIFNRRNVLGGRYAWRIENYSYYLPIQIRRLRSCRNNILCKGDQGSYADEFFYHFIPVGDNTHVDCYSVQGRYYYFHDYNGQQYAVPLSSIWENTRLHHIRLNNINDI